MENSRRVTQETPEDRFRFLTNETHRLALALILAADDIMLRIKPLNESLHRMESLSRELSFVADSIKEFTLKLAVKVGG